MHLRSLRLFQFKNHEESAYSFPSRVNLVTGPNGAGKTNLLDAIFYLCFTKSVFRHEENMNVQNGKEEFSLTGLLETDDGEETPVRCHYRKDGDKKFYVREKQIQRLSSHIGNVLAVFSLPKDRELVEESPGIRRRFADRIISQYDREYLQALITYNRALQRRNSLLQKFREERKYEKDQFEYWNKLLSEKYSVLYMGRKIFCEEIQPLLAACYSLLAEEEFPGVIYQSSYSEDYSGRLELMLREDVTRGATGEGAHKDDFTFSLNGQPLKYFASQGQQKTFYLALRLAEYDLLHTRSRKKPILLLDDLCDKLDTFRIRTVFEVISQGKYGQIFLSDTDETRLRKHLGNGSVFDVHHLHRENVIART